MQLNDGRVVEYIKEMNSPWSAAFETIWPTLIVQKELNTLGMRHVVPHGSEFIIQWTLFGYDDDTEEMVRHDCDRLISSVLRASSAWKITRCSSGCRPVSENPIPARGWWKWAPPPTV